MQDVDFIVPNRSYIDVLPNTTDGYIAELHFVFDNGVVFNSSYPNLTHFQESAFNSYLHENLLKPHGIAICKSRDILVCLWNRRYSDQSAGKVVKLHQKSEIVLEIESEKNIPLFVCPTYITENGNGDICVSDVRAVVVTDAGGMLRFRYQGNSRESIFDPYGICCDSSCNIIVADMKNDKLHIADKDGRFLYLVTYDGIKMPRALCIDEHDSVYVGEWDTDTIKVIVR